MGSLILILVGEEDSLLSAALGAGAGGSSSVSVSCGDIVGLCLVGENLLILMLARLFTSLK